MRPLTCLLFCALLLAALPGGATSAASGPVGTLEVSKEAGLGRVEIYKKIAAVLQRDEGAVALVDISQPSKPRILGRYDDDIQDSFDGDLAFSTDGKWLFYARQTHQFSKDGIHVLDISDPKMPALTHYQPQGGTFRIAYFKQGDAQWVFTLDAIHGLVVNRFIPQAGSLVPVHVDALPALKVGGPASAGLFVERKDPILGVPLLYAATGRTGVQVFDISDPTAPQLLGQWSDVGLAEIEVRSSKNKRVIYGATEYWFNKQLEPEVVVLDATKLDAIEKHSTWALGCPADDQWRVQGMALAGGELLVAHSRRGLVRMDGRSATNMSVAVAPRNESATVLGEAPFVFDVEAQGRYLYATDAASGFLSVLRRASSGPLRSCG